MKSILTLVLSVALMASAPSCKTLNKMNLNPAELTTGAWQLNEIAGASTDAAGYMKGLPFLKFAADGQFSGSTGCNSLGGTYTIEGSSLALTPGAMSKMMCPGTGERDFLSGLKDAASANIKGEVLSVTNSAGEAIMKFVKQPDEK